MTNQPHGARALIVDDEEADRAKLVQLVEQEGYSVTTARTGREGLSCLQSNEFDLVVLDVLMPGMDGFEVMRSIRDQKPEVMGRTIVVSRLANQDLKVFFPTVAQVFTKPVDADAFRNAIHGISRRN